MPLDACEALTVTVLPDLLALVHIPRSRLVHFSHQVVKQLLAPSPTFLNITCNKIELSLFAHHSVLADFEPLARKDRHRYRRAHTTTHRAHARSRQNSVTCPEPIEVSYDTWNVLQLDSHDDRLDKAGARVRELSSPLAQAGISILYQSSYTSDFIFVKSSRLNEVLARLAQAGFVGYSSDIPAGISSGPSVQDDEDSPEAPLSRTDSATELVLQRNNPPAFKVTSPPSDSDTTTPTSITPATSSRTSVSPCAGDVKILDQDVVCVGLSDSAADVWTSKIIKLVAYPELLVPALSTHSRPAQVQTNSTPHPKEPLDDVPASKLGIDIPRRRPDFWPYPSPSASSSSSSIGTPASSSEDGYFSSEVPYTPPSSGKGSPRGSFISCSRSFPELNELITGSSSMHTHSNHLPRASTVTGNLSAGFRPGFSSHSQKKDDPVPFFSFTRTAEGSSLTTGRELIAALFPVNERHMIICGDELDDDEHGSDDEDDDDGSWGGEFDDNTGMPSKMKCLQIDLHRFGLDKHGLINRFSRVLDSNGINHMYSSTYKTANLLVDKKDALRAASLLRSC